MSVDLVNGHVLIPHLPDWSSAVSHRRQWQTNVEAAITGAEHRRAVRTRPRITLGWHLIPFDVADQARLQARLRAARKSGYACAPYWGRGLAILSAASEVLTLAADAWPFLEVDDYLLIRRLDVADPESWEAVQFAESDGADLTLSAAPDGDWSSGAYIWPLLFGAISTDDLRHRSDWHAGVRCELRTLATRELNPWDYSACAIVDLTAADTFDCYGVGWTDAEGFPGGNGWSGAWTLTAGAYVLALDEFAYSTGEVTGSLGGGTNWSGSWELI